MKKHAPKKFVSGEEFFYLGDKYPLKVVKPQDTKPQSGSLEFNSGFYIPEDDIPYAKSIFIKWYKRQAKLNIPKRVRWYASSNGLKYQGIRITGASRRWGSCTATGNLNFSWKLMFLPLKIVDYVVVHELAHLKQHNHSRKFWAEVEKMLPDYKERRKWLKNNGEELAF